MMMRANKIVRSPGVCLPGRSFVRLSICHTDNMIMPLDLINIPMAKEIHY